MTWIETGWSAFWKPVLPQSIASLGSVTSWKTRVAGATRNRAFPSAAPQIHSAMKSMSRAISLVQSPRSGSPARNSIAQMVQSCQERRSKSASVQVLRSPPADPEMPCLSESSMVANQDHRRPVRSQPVILPGALAPTRKRRSYSVPTTHLAVVKWSGRLDSNQRPRGPKPRALAKLSYAPSERPLWRRAALRQAWGRLRRTRPARAAGPSARAGRQRIRRRVEARAGIREVERRPPLEEVDQEPHRVAQVHRPRVVRVGASAQASTGSPLKSDARMRTASFRFTARFPSTSPR